jgi:hypothetical protein
VESPPDPAPHAGPGNRPDAPGTSEKAEKTKETDWPTRWAAVGALGTAAAAVIAFLAYAHPSGPSPRPSPSTSQAPPPRTVQPTEHSSLAPAMSPASPSLSPTPAPAQPSEPPAGCQQGEAVITTYNKTVGSTWASEADAAERAWNGTGAVLSSGPSPDSAVNYDLEALGNDFADLYNDAMGYSSDYEESAATADTDMHQLAADCGN